MKTSEICYEDRQTEICLKQPYEISRATYRCNSPERKLLYFAARKIQLETHGKTTGYIATFSISEMLEALGMSNQTNNRQHIRQAIETIATKNEIIIQNDENTFEAYFWLSYAKYDDKSDKAILKFSEEIGALFELCKERFSLINLKTIGSLTSYYAMRYYELAVSYIGFKGQEGNPPNTWYFDLSVDEIKQMFKIEKGYEQRVDNFFSKTVKMPIEELNEKNPDFKIEIAIVKDVSDKRKTAGYRFTCTDCLKNFFATTVPAKTLEKEHLEIEKEFAEMEVFINNQASDFYKRYAIRLMNKKPYETETGIKVEIYQQMKAELSSSKFPKK